MSRIISATNKNLEEKVKDGSFREDPVFSPECHTHKHSALERKKRGYTGLNEAFHRKVFEGIRQGNQDNIFICTGASHEISFSGKREGA